MIAKANPQSPYFIAEFGLYGELLSLHLIPSPSRRVRVLGWSVQEAELKRRIPIGGVSVNDCSPGGMISY